MAIRIIEVHLEGGHGHEHIARLKWVSDSNQKVGTNSRAEIVSFLEHDQGTAYVRDNHGHSVGVRVVTPSFGAKYLRTYKDGVPTDNLLALPRF